MKNVRDSYFPSNVCNCSKNSTFARSISLITPINNCPIIDQRILHLPVLKMKLYPSVFSLSWPAFIWAFVQPMYWPSSMFEQLWKLLDIFISLTKWLSYVDTTVFRCCSQYWSNIGRHSFHFQGKTFLFLKSFRIFSQIILGCIFKEFSRASTIFNNF